MVAGKLLNLSEVIEKIVHDEVTFYMAGFMYLISHSAGHEIIRQGIKN